ncbi:hypothetical protein M0R19_03740 [Candidatus Pacearchaeota archaeon]|nr:hypothetical protein [Candidatus Pacearchaeota archaeon]
MILTGKIYTYKNENKTNLYLEINKNWFLKNLLKDLFFKCRDCIKKNKDNCLFLYFCKSKRFDCYPKNPKFKLIENNIVG